jgi:hypothetical protein
MVLLVHFVGDMLPTNGVERAIVLVTGYGTYGVDQSSSAILQYPLDFSPDSKLGPMPADPLPWALVVATYMREDVLLRCLRLGAAQTQPPIEIIVVDSSPG